MADGANQTRTMRGSYRPDIDGLRAIAVLGVVAYHLGLNGGGYVGVDVFFVISGFLITQILIEELAASRSGTQILARFYERRIRRILPALVVVCALSYAAAVLWLFPEDLREFGRSLQSVAIFISNIHFQRKTGYFDGAADEKPLLHTWSLAVEEQYYVLFPLALWLIWRWRGATAAFAICLVIAAASLVYAEFQVRSAPEAAFFSTPARIWELLTGALLAMARDWLPAARPARETMAATGAVLVAVTYASYSPTTSFPGLGAIMPVLGSALLIAAGAKGGAVVSRVLSAPILVGIGLISYSVYLWHWPLMVFVKYRFAPLLEQHASAVSALLFAVSLLLGYLSWRFVEQPFRRPSSTQGRHRVFAVQTVTMLVMVLGGIALSRLDGLPGRWSDGVLAVLNPQAAFPASQRPICRPAAPARFEQIRICDANAAVASGDAVLLWGDSHAAMLSDEIARHAGKDRTVFTAINAGCPPLAGVVLGGRGRSDKCRQHNARVLEFLAQTQPRVSKVLLVARWPYYAEGTRMPYESGQGVLLGEGDPADAHRVMQVQLTATVESLLQSVDAVALLAPFPEFDRPVAVSLARARAWGHAPLERQTAAALARRQRSSIAALQTAAGIAPHRIAVVSPLSHFCDQAGCDFADADGRPLFTDTNHLSAPGIARIAPLFDTMLAAPAARHSE